jgi:FkbM family methyltransferase
VTDSFDTGGFGRVSRCRYGYMLSDRNDVFIGRSLQLYGEWAQSELELLALILHPGDAVIDVGANLGTHTVCFAQKVGPTGRVFAFEPQRIVFQMLCANVALSGLLNVHAVNAGLARQPGAFMAHEVVDYDRPGNFGAITYDRTTATPATTPSNTPAKLAGEPTTFMTLDQLPLDRCRLLKIDVEGMELEVLQGGANLIKTTRPIIYVENNHPDRSPSLIAHLLSLDYRLFWHYSPFYNPKNFAGNPENVFDSVGDINLVAVDAALAPAFRSLPAVSGPDDSWQAVQTRTQKR